MAKSTANADEERARLIAGFDQLPDSALVNVPTGAAVVGEGESTFWKKARHSADHPKIVKLSTRCSRVRVGEIRAYLAMINGQAMAAAEQSK